MSTSTHIPVLLTEVIDSLNLQPHQIYIDATFGVGGYTRGILTAEPLCRVYGFDRDPEAMERAQAFTAEFGDRFRFVHACFGDMETEMRDLGVTHVQGIAFDLGVSSPQLDQAERGFSFQKDGPLDMRMSKTGRTAADVVNTYSEKELADIIYIYGEEKRSRAIARKLVDRRKTQKFERTLDLAETIRSVVPPERKGIHPATRTFQAFRIYVNNELGEIERGFEAAENLLSDKGRLAIVTFHSLEDRLAKTFIHQRSRPPQTDRRNPYVASFQPIFKEISKKAIAPTAQEIKMNPRSRSAKLRVAERIRLQSTEGVGA